MLVQIWLDIKEIQFTMHHYLKENEFLGIIVLVLSMPNNLMIHSYLENFFPLFRIIVHKLSMKFKKLTHC